MAPRMSSRAHVLVWLVLFVVGQSYAFLHHAVTDHHACVEESTLVHGHCHHGGCESDSAAQEVDESAADAIVGAVEAIGESEHGHGHACSVPDANEIRKWVPATPVLRLWRDRVVRICDSPRSQEASASVPRFRLAPKNSPPRAA